MNSVVQKMVNCLKAAYPCLVIKTSEEKRAQADILTAARTIGRKVATWSASEGVVLVEGRVKIKFDGKDTEDFLDALKYIKSNVKDDTIYILRDIHQLAFERDPTMSRYLRDVITDASERGCTLIVIVPEFRPIKSIENLVTIIDYDLPSYDDFAVISNNIAEGAGKPHIKATEEALKALAGLSTPEAENALALSLVETGKFSASVIYREKVAAVKRSGLLEIIDPDPRGLEAIGGLENLKEWVLKRKKAYSTEAEKYGLPTPKGILLIGVPGSGKSLSAKAFGTALGIPTLKLDIGNLFNSLVGESESRTREALKLAEAMAPCCLFADEIDKGLSGAQGSGSNDSGVTRRVFGTLLSWMQDKKKPVFVIATANQVDALPPEFLRKGRFDEIFTLDLPHKTEREQIAAVVLKKLKRDPKNFDLVKIAEATPEFTGAEIEACCVDALYSAFDVSKEVTTEDIVAAAANVVPIAKVMAEKIEAIRSWGESRARPASNPQVVAPAATTSTRKIKA